MSLAFSLVDLAVVLVILGSMAYATWRGFISEALGIVAWAAAAFASLYFGGWVGRLAHSLISTTWIAMVAGYALVFIVVFIPLQFASHRFSESVKRSAVGPLDRVLGATFGIVRGLAILGIAYMVFDAFVPIRDQPKWLTEARTLPLIQSSAEVLLALVPKHDDRDVVAPVAVKPVEIAPMPHANHATVQPPPAKKKKAKKTHGAEDRRALDRLFQATGNDGSGNR